MIALLLEGLGGGVVGGEGEVLGGLLVCLGFGRGDLLLLEMLGLDNQVTGVHVN